MLSGARIEELARRLDQAEQTQVQIRQFSLEQPDLTVEDAYAIQKRWVELKVERGQTIKGHKIGLTSKAMQNASDIHEPDYGSLMDDMFFADASEIPISRFIMPRVECELAFILAKPLKGPNCTIFDVLNAADFVTPAVEIIDSRVHMTDPDTKRSRKVTDTISDNAANAGIVLGGRPFRPLDADMRWISAICYRNGAVEESGVAAAVLNHPANGVAWLANRLARYDIGLEAGEVVLGGSFTRPTFAKQDDTFHVDYGPWGAISFHFS
jgi:2-oxo-hept-3-ene-1,7-dioate hydratase